MFNLSEIVALIIMGFTCRLILWAIIMQVFKTNKTIVLHPIFGFLAIMHYILARDSYAEYEFFNFILVAGFVLPELFNLKTNKRGSRHA